mmetsp:Transcript_44673/g.107721  ORF Transcript_44673/g.107721 Transcript_44673/m.107721 type:complete len:172 (-) Transcript_44673:541-1056(-)|eukprot:CAMPEP_0113620246 /NCGR_PEP_ID=MMETSP0017_2-20120614/10309_1 /TAXON_ID=2856 /ORGANISM="Cylindrotheca closterium" /LENGTH=171 /DNA_ID=CAMNT_0000529891 /DNA_START=325 /DNA_END=840 /DNA_ORIENTATION=+ /assembly_acc=CAM_ASM_000147
MKLLNVALLLLTLGDSNGFQVPYPGGSGIATRCKSEPQRSSLLICHMLMNNDSFNSNSSSSQHLSKHYFQNQKVNGEVAKSSDHDDGSYHHHHHPTHHHHHHHQKQTCTGLRMAHGAICPETIAVFEKNSNPAIRRFVETYHKRGPLACEDLLSDPEVLPHLTRAMRDIHA